jgi:lipopolysaccharide/colanic/teichoic acid biosynthesis glycosyltransferase
MYAWLKRGMDIAISGTAIIMLAPLLLLLVLFIRLDSPGPALFMQPRIGRNGTVFHIIKFRSMVKDAPSLGPYWTADNDPRITRAGKFLRQTSFDELPQLINVFLGDMSLVGPRPDSPAQQELYSPETWRQRHRVRPGITGLAQVNGRSSITPEQRLEYDLAYAANPGFMTDLGILLKTVRIAIARADVN